MIVAGMLTTWPIRSTACNRGMTIFARMLAPIPSAKKQHPARYPEFTADIRREQPAEPIQAGADKAHRRRIKPGQRAIPPKHACLIGALEIDDCNLQENEIRVGQIASVDFKACSVSIMDSRRMPVRRRGQRASAAEFRPARSRAHDEASPRNSCARERRSSDAAKLSGASPCPASN